MHLSADTLVDLAEGQRLESSEPHLQHCEECRRQLVKLRGVLTAAAQASVPEPSPLFWDHFSERVRRAVAAEGAPPRSRFGSVRAVLPSSFKTAAPWLAVAAAIVMAIAVARGPAFRGAPSTASSIESGDIAVLAPYGTSDDSSLALVSDLAAQMDPDAAVEAGFANHPGGVDEVVATLTDSERVELQRLLKEELAKS